MPVGLFASAEDDHIVYIVALGKEYRGGESGAKRRQLSGVDESASSAVWGKEGNCALDAFGS